MADNSGNSLEYWLSIPSPHKQAIYKLRKWSHLKIARDEDLIWVRGFTKTEIESTDVLKIPRIERYYLRGARLVLYRKSLPDIVEPTLLWSPIQRGLKVSLPKENFNYFGINQVQRINLVPSERNKAINATIVQLDHLERYLFIAPKIRLKSLKWTIIENDMAIILGRPLLPIQGQDLYQNSCFLIPAGYKFEYESMVKIYKKALGESIDFWYLLDEKSEMYKLRKTDFNRLTKGSFVNTILAL